MRLMELPLAAGNTYLPPDRSSIWTINTSESRLLAQDLGGGVKALEPFSSPAHNVNSTFPSHKDSLGISSAQCYDHTTYAMSDITDASRKLFTEAWQYDTML